jgi:hypothetical protein
VTEPLERGLRSRLEAAVKQARRQAEAGAQAALHELGVADATRPAHLNDAQGRLRVRLRAHGRQLGDSLNGGKVQTITHLVQEVAYQHWHRMLFARFLAENQLLMYDGVAVTLEECEELAADEGARNGWELAGRLAERMLPQIFKAGSPVFELALPADVQIPLETLLASLSPEVFTASDSLGWVYQFWQAEQKDTINKSEVKIGAEQLPAVTQLFTEPYMVAFLLHNSLGAWWNTRHPDTPCPVTLEYLRTLEDGTPAAGKFEGWPDSLADFKLLDPCCGSGHFLVAAFLMLVPMRMAAEGLSAREAVDRVLEQNLHGLELDARCVEIAVFAVALEAWRYPDERGQPLGVREIPSPHIACCGLKVAGKAEDWQALVPDDAANANALREGLARLHQQFAQAPLLGSLLSPSRQKGDLYSADYAQLEPLLVTALKQEGSGEEAGGRRESALSALGLLDAARLLEARYQLVITNVPFLTGIKFSDRLKVFIESHYETGKANLATAMAIRLLDLLDLEGLAAYVAPQSWMFLKGYSTFRAHLMQERSIRVVARLGEKGFQSAQANGEQVSLNIVGTGRSQSGFFHSLDASPGADPEDKASLLISGPLGSVDVGIQMRQSQNVISFSSRVELPELGTCSSALRGCGTGDAPRFVRSFVEMNEVGLDWAFHQTTASGNSLFDGMSEIILWEQEKGSLAAFAESVRHLNHAAQNWRRGKPNWGKKGVMVSQMGEFSAALYEGSIYDPNCCAIVPSEEDLVPAIWAFCESKNFCLAVKSINQNRKVEVRTFLSVGFDAPYWKQVAAERYPHGLPKPYSDDPTQWIFHGHPCGSVVWDEDAKRTADGPLRVEANVLQIAVARLLGYRWPAETDAQMELADEQRAWVKLCDALAAHADRDGIVCLPPVGREKPAADRLLNLLAAAYGPAWNNDVLARLLASAGHAGKSLESWLREKFFAQHCELFHQCPFIWHIWDGLRDGFAALVNYHRLDTKTLEALIYTHLGDWISRQTRDLDAGVEGAQEKLHAAQALKQRLELILKGEQPHDIFVRWKPLDQQPIGWDPDLNDGVRLNIRPFLSVPDVGKKGAGVLRERPKVKWDKDRGSDVSSAPWYHLGPQVGGKQGDRVNDHHLSLAEKQRARKQ